MSPIEMTSRTATGDEGDCVYCGNPIKQGEQALESPDTISRGVEPKYYHQECFAKMLSGMAPTGAKE